MHEMNWDGAEVLIGGVRLDPAPIAVETMTLSQAAWIGDFEVGDLWTSDGQTWRVVGQDERGTHFEVTRPVGDNGQPPLWLKSATNSTLTFGAPNEAPGPGNRHERRRAAALARRR